MSGRRASNLGGDLTRLGLDPAPHRPDLDADDGDEGMAVSVSIMAPGDRFESSHRHLPGDADHEQIADALVRCLLGVAASHGSLGLVATVVSRMRQEVSG